MFRNRAFLIVVFIYLFFALISMDTFAEVSPTCGTRSFLACYVDLPGHGFGSVATNTMNTNCPNSGGIPAVMPATSCNSTTNTSYDGNAAFCLRDCTCPEGYILSGLMHKSGFHTPICVEDTPPPICVYPNVNVGGNCVCDAGYTTQGFINDQPICQLQCPEGTFPGAVNGVSGCYGPGEQPSCPDGYSWGSVNGINGCWGADGSGGSNSSGGSGSSSGGGQGSSSGGGDGGNNGGGGGGGGGPYTGAPYDPSESCPAGFDKTSDGQCVGEGDCFPGYQSVVISKSPFYAMCMPIEVPPSSSSSSSTSSSSSASSQQGPGDGSSSGNASSGGGSNGGGNGDGEGMEWSGDCDPTAANYFDCISPSSDMPSHTTTGSGATTFAQVNANFFNALSQTGPIVAMRNMVNVVELSDPACPSFSFDLSDTVIGRAISTDIHCVLWEEVAGLLSVVMIAVWIFFAFRIFASA